MRDNENRTVKKSFRFTASEWQRVTEKCNVAGITTTQYFQQIALNGKVAKKNCLKEKQIYLGELGKIGNNLNQIARKLNSEKRTELWMLEILIKIENHLNKKLLL